MTREINRITFPELSAVPSVGAIKLTRDEVVQLASQYKLTAGGLPPRPSFIVIRSETAIDRIFFNAETQNPFPPRYILVELIGQGATGEVYAVWDLHTNRELVMKVAYPEIIKNRPEVLRREAKMQDIIGKIACSVPNLNIPFPSAYLNINWIDGNLRAGILSEKVSDPDLERIMFEFATKKISFDVLLEIVSALGLTIGQAIDQMAMHDTFHKDINVRNIKIGCEKLPDDSKRYVITLLDFGIANLVIPPEPDRIFGTPIYIPFEAWHAKRLWQREQDNAKSNHRLTGKGQDSLAKNQWMDNKFTVQREQYALAVVLVQLLIGIAYPDLLGATQTPDDVYAVLYHYNDVLLQALKHELEVRGLDEFFIPLARALNNDPTMRYSTAAEFGFAICAASQKCSRKKRMGDHDAVDKYGQKTFAFSSTEFNMLHSSRHAATTPGGARSPYEGRPTKNKVTQVVIDY